MLNQFQSFKTLMMRGGVDALSFSPDGQLLAIGTSTEGCKLLRTTDWQTVRTLSVGDVTRSIQFAPDGKLVYIGTSIAHQIQVWDSKTWKKIRTLKGHSQEVIALSINANSSLIASGSRDGTFRVWNSSGKCLLASKPGRSFVYSLNFLSKGSWLAVTQGEKISVWDTDSLSLHTELPSQEVAFAGVNFSPDGRYLIASGVAPDHAITVWERGSQTSPWQILHRLKGHTRRITSLSVSPDSKIIVSAGVDGDIHVWDIASGTLTGLLKGHQGNCQSLVFHPDGKVIASGSIDGTVIIWRETPPKLDK